MDDQAQDHLLRQKAAEKVDARIEFKVHLTVYIVVNTFLFLTWLVIGLIGDAWFPWFLFPLVFWGIGVFSHGYSVYRGDRFDRTREEKIQREMERIKKERD